MEEGEIDKEEGELTAEDSDSDVTGFILPKPVMADTVASKLVTCPYGLPKEGDITKKYDLSNPKCRGNFMAHCIAHIIDKDELTDNHKRALVQGIVPQGVKLKSLGKCFLPFPPQTPIPTVAVPPAPAVAEALPMPPQPVGPAILPLPIAFEREKHSIMYSPAVPKMNLPPATAGQIKLCMFGHRTLPIGNKQYQGNYEAHLLSHVVNPNWLNEYKRNELLAGRAGGILLKDLRNCKLRFELGYEGCNRSQVNPSSPVTSTSSAAALSYVPAPVVPVVPPAAAVADTVVRTFPEEVLQPEEAYLEAQKQENLRERGEEDESKEMSYTGGSGGQDFSVTSDVMTTGQSTDSKPRAVPIGREPEEEAEDGGGKIVDEVVEKINDGSEDRVQAEKRSRPRRDRLGLWKLIATVRERRQVKKLRLCN
eukprot:gb/GEZN01005357.1/.p1 GENE.gb/GEZN01005357.1/~~gb/GEZN01005357.1/.p1  ORF type:complete len:423 (+),score=66.14 gb/GEZN01005357.1/:298-1566(+)